MRALRWLLVGSAVLSFTACGGGNNKAKPDGGDTGPKPQCSDGVDNDSDGKIDYPYDPGCYAPNQDDETDDCPSGMNCPQCGNGIDDDMNGSTDYPEDPGCSAASDTDEYTDNPVACGNNVTIKKLPFDGHATGTLGSSASSLSGSCGGPGAEDVYELRIQHPKVVVASTDMGSTVADTVLYIRSAACTDSTMELGCSDDISTSDHNSTVTASIVQPGTYYLVVDTKSSTGDDCGPGLVCRVPLNGTSKVCAKHVCQDGVDDDADGKNDYPDDPGCVTAVDDDETDDCPSGANCPECGDGRDNDMDGKTDYPMDTQCQAASSTSEACQSHEAVAELTMPSTMGDTTSATSDFETCGYDTGVPDLTYRIDVPALDSLSITSTTTTWSSEVELLNSTCGGTALTCSYGSISQTNVTAGAYYVVVDGDFTGDQGPFTLTVSGKIKNHQSCESVLAQSGALTCGTGYACSGTMGSRTCEPALCSDGIDNDHDGKIDYPNDPGCSAPDGNDETDPATEPVCSNGMDDDTDTKVDYPADFGCASAADTSEAFCTGEMDPPVLVTTRTTNGTTTGASNDSTPACGSSSAPELSFALQLPVPVTTLQLDSAGTGTSPMDTIMSVRDTHCATSLACNDDGPSGIGPSQIIMSNVSAGGYTVQVDGFSTANGPFTLTVHGSVAAGVDCTSPLFSGGANAVLTCPSSCNTTTHKCQ